MLAGAKPSLSIPAFGVRSLFAADGVADAEKD